MEISSMAMCRRCLSLGLAKRRDRSRFWMSLIRSQPTPRWTAHVADGHAATQFQGVALEGRGVAPPRVGEGDLDLADDATGLAFDARDGQVQDRVFLRNDRLRSWVQEFRRLSRRPPDARFL